MRTFDERTQLIHKRTAELRKKEQRKKALLIDISSMTVCLLSVIALGICMPAVMGNVSAVEFTNAVGTASIFGDAVWMGYVVVGILAFVLGAVVTILLYRLHRRLEHVDREK